MNKTRAVSVYLFFDILAACLSWLLFYVYRNLYIETNPAQSWLDIDFNHRLLIALLLLPAFWLTIYYVSGYYTNILRKSRLIELWQTLFTSVCGVVVLFFILLLDDRIHSYDNYCHLFFTLLALQFGNNRKITVLFFADQGIFSANRTQRLFGFRWPPNGR